MADLCFVFLFFFTPPVNIFDRLYKMEKKKKKQICIRTMYYGQLELADWSLRKGDYSTALHSEV